MLTETVRLVACLLHKQFTTISSRLLNSSIIPQCLLRQQYRLHQTLHTTFCEVPFFLPLNPQPIW
jgi:uncharacterized protein VirK/YbjX